MRSYFRRGGMRCSSRGKPYYRQGGYCFRHTSSRLSPSAAFLRLRRAWVLSRMPQVRSFTVGGGDGLNRLMDAFEAVRGVPPYMLPLRAEKKLRVWHPRATQQQYREIMDRLLAMGDVTTTPDLVPPVAFLPARVILGLFVALVALGLLFANSRPDPRNAPPPKATTSRAIPHKASQSPVAQYAAAIAWFNPELTDDWDRRLAGAILRSCRRQGIDGRLLMAVMAVESNFDIGARPQAKIDRKVSHLRRCLQQTFHSSDAPSSALGMSAVLTHYGMRHRARAQVWRLYSGMCGQK